MIKIKEYFTVMAIKISLITFAIVTAILLVISLFLGLFYWVVFNRNMFDDVVGYTQRLFKVTLY